MKAKLFLMMTICLLGFSNAQAESTGKRQIVNIGCYKSDYTCFVHLSGDAVGPESCRSTSVRWNRNENANGQEMFSLLTAAFFANKQVALEIKDTCYSWQVAYPTFRWIHVYQ